MFRKRSGRSKPTAWETRHKAGAILAGLVFVALLAVGLGGLGAGLGIYILGRSAPSITNNQLISQRKMEKSKNVTDMERDPAFLAKRRILRLRAFSNLLMRDAFRFQGYHLGFDGLREKYHYLSLGATGEAEEEDPSWGLPVRMSSLASLFTALLVAAVLVSAPRLLGHWKIVGPAVFGFINFVAVYVTAQGLAATFRRRIDSSALQWVEVNSDMKVVSQAPTEPSDILDRDAVTQLATIPAFIRTVFTLVPVGASVFFITGWSGVGRPLAIIFGVLSGLAVVSWRLVRAYRTIVLADWHEEQGKISEWEAIWQGVGVMVNAPEFILYQGIPDPEETGSDPDFDSVTFRTPIGAQFQDYSGFAADMRSNLPGGGNHVFMIPLPAVDDSDSVIVGEPAGHIGFKLIWSASNFGPRSHFDLSLHEETHTALVKYAVFNVLQELKCPGWVNPIRVTVLTKDTAKVPVVEYCFSLQDGVSEEWLRKNLTALGAKLGAEWVRLGDNPLSAFPDKFPALYMSPKDPSVNERTDYRSRKAAEHIESLDLLAVMEASGLAGLVCEQVVTLTKRGTTPVIKASTWNLPHGLSYAMVQAKADVIAEKLGVPWCRVGKRYRIENGQLVLNSKVAIAFGDTPTEPTFIKPEDETWIESLEWVKHFTKAKLIDAKSGETPLLLEREVLRTDPDDRSFDVEELEFNARAAATFEAVEGKLPELGAESGRGFIEARRVPGRSDRFGIIAARQNPLDSAKIFSEYSDELMVGPGEKPNMKWAIGPDATGKLMWDDWADADVPHLAIFAGTKAGKTTVLQDMLLQLMYNNTPDQLRFVFAEPKLGLESWREVDHVDRVIWMQDRAPAGTDPDIAKRRQGVFLGRLAWALAKEEEEMFCRNEIFSSYGKELVGAAVGNIAEAWTVGLKHDVQELCVPLRIIVIEEAIMGLSVPDKKIDPEGFGWHAQVMASLGNIAVAGRSAGIHLTMIAQDATKSAFPILIKKQSRRLGLKLGTSMASLSAIEQTGLEKLPGYGHGLYESMDYGWVRVRALYPDTETVGHWIEQLPKTPGRIDETPLLGMDGDEDDGDFGDVDIEDIWG